jgi:hypothetical protein
MNAKRGSTVVLTTVKSSRNRSAMRGQYCTLAPPIGSAPILTPARAIASTSMTPGRSST